MATKNWTEEFGIHQQTLEGHGLIRVAAAVGALALVCGCVMETLNLEENIQHPPRLLLKAYTALFGLIVFLNECKSGTHPSLDTWRNWSFKWFPFASVALGKGVFLIFVGLITLGFYHSLFIVSPGLFLALIGVCYIVAYVSQKQHMDNAIDKSYVLHAQGVYEPLRYGEPGMR